MIIEVKNEADMMRLGARLGAKLKGGEAIELVGDVGAGKTTLTKGIARGLGIKAEVQSPSYTISRLYKAPNDLQLAHYDFYRLPDAGIIASELAETTRDSKTVTVIEWSDAVKDVLPTDRISIQISTLGMTGRRLDISGVDL